MSSIISGKFSIQLFVRDLEQAAAWYCRHLGFQLGPHNYDDFAELHLNGRNIMHLLKNANASPLPEPSFYLDTGNIESAYRALKQSGVHVTELILRSDHAEFQFTDLEGNRIGISHFPDSGH